MFTLRKRAQTFFQPFQKSFQLISVFETITFIAVVLIADILMGEGARFFNAGFHPFWMIILLVSLLYGLEEGLIATILCSIALLAGNIPMQRINEDSYEYGLRIIFNPLMWLMAVFFVGGLRNRELQKFKDVETQKGEAEEKTEKISQQYLKANEINSALEMKLASYNKTIFTISSAIQEMENGDTPSLFKGADALIRSLLAPEQSSIFLLKGDRLSLRANSGWPEKHEYKETYTAQTPLFTEIVSNRRLLSISNMRDELTLDGAILAAPIVNPATSTVYGMIKIEKIPFILLNDETSQTLNLIGQWIGSALHKAYTIEEAKSTSMIEPEMKVRSAPFYKMQVAFTLSLAQRVKFPLTVVMLNIQEDNLPHSERIAFSTALSDMIKKVMRQTDLIFASPSEGTAFALLLPNTNLNGAQIVAQKLHNGLKAYTPHAGLLTHSVQVLHE